MTAGPLTDRGERISALCVADSDEALALVERRLPDDGFEVVTERASAAPLDARDLEDVDCLVAAGPSGHDLVASKRPERPSLPVVLVTGTDDPSTDVLETIETNPDADFVRRSVLEFDDRSVVLARRLRHLVERRRAKTAATRARAALETARDGIAVISAGGRLVEVNGAFAARFGYDRDDLLDARWTRLFSDAEVDRLESTVLDAVDDTWRWTGECTGVRADGEPVPVRMVISRLEDGSLAFAVHDAND